MLNDLKRLTLYGGDAYDCVIFTLYLCDDDQR